MQGKDCRLVEKHHWTLYMCARIHVYAYIYGHACVHIRLYVRMQTSCMHIVCLLAYIRAHIIYKLRHVNMCIRPYTRQCLHGCRYRAYCICQMSTHVYADMRIHARMYAHTRTHTEFEHMYTILNSATDVDNALICVGNRRVPKWTRRLMKLTISSMWCRQPVVALCHISAQVHHETGTGRSPISTNSPSLLRSIPENSRDRS